MDARTIPPSMQAIMRCHHAARPVDHGAQLKDDPVLTCARDHGGDHLSSGRASLGAAVLLPNHPPQHGSRQRRCGASELRVRHLSTCCGRGLSHGWQIFDGVLFHPPLPCVGNRQRRAAEQLHDLVIPFALVTQQQDLRPLQDARRCFLQHDHQPQASAFFRSQSDRIIRMATHKMHPSANLAGMSNSMHLCDEMPSVSDYSR